MSQSLFWTLTLFNYKQDDIDKWKTLVDQGVAKYCCFQEESCPTIGKAHLQGYIVFQKRIRLGGVKKALGAPSVHAVRSNGTPSQNRDYCSKSKTAIEGSFCEVGQIPEDPVRGKRNDFEPFKEAVAQGLRCKRKAREDFPELVAKYPRWCYDYLADQKDISVEEHTPREWQVDLSTLLSQEPDDRVVFFVVDKEGNRGKTWFAKHYCKHHSDAQYMEPAKKADMSYALQDDLRVLFINITRSSAGDKGDYIYSFIEAVKDGMVFSSKYESRTKYFGKCHVVVMMNQEPNYELLSADRYRVIDLN